MRPQLLFPSVLQLIQSRWKNKLWLKTDSAADLSPFTATRSCGTLCAVSSIDLGPMKTFQGRALKVTKISTRALEVSAGQRVDVDTEHLEEANSQLQEQLHIEFR